MEALSLDELFALATKRAKRGWSLECCPAYSCEPHWHGEPCYWVYTRDFIGPYRSAGDKRLAMTPKQALLNFIEEIEGTPLETERCPA